MAVQSGYLYTLYALRVIMNTIYMLMQYRFCIFLCLRMQGYNINKTRKYSTFLFSVPSHLSPSTNLFKND